MRTGSPRPRPDPTAARQRIEAQVLRIVRDARFARGAECPHCEGARVVRWGTFSGRQRYRCRGCGRTFSDLTSTPLSYTKRLSAWPGHLQRMRFGATLRDTAAAVGVHLSTSFRWRHRTLAGLRRREHRQLDGLIELAPVDFAFSRKGERGVEEPRRCGALDHVWEWFAAEGVRVALLQDRSGRNADLTVPWGVPSVQDMDEFFRRDVAPASTIICGYRGAHHFGNAARRAGHTLVVLKHRDDADAICHTDNIGAYTWRLRDWLLPFRGVATKYLANYIAWHRLVDVEVQREWLQRCAGRAGPGP